MEKLKLKSQKIEKQILLAEKQDVKETLITEMKKIGIEKLPYSYTSLKKFIDSETMSIHYNRHYKNYVEKLNKLISKKDYPDMELEEIVKSISRFNKGVRNNAGGAFNHALFWKMLSPTTQEPNGEVLERIKKDFGTYKSFVNMFQNAAKERFGSGWVWLVLTKNNVLKILSTENQDNPLMNVVKDGGYPILGLDLWEHAYYLKYRNKRDEYVTNFWKCVNWEFVNSLYNSRLKKKINETENLRKLISETKSNTCSWPEVEAIRFIFNNNPNIKYMYRTAIDIILSEVFPEHYYKENEYEPNSLYGIYDLEQPGRSGINKLNTNYNTFCTLLKDINLVITREKGSDPINKINIVGVKPFEQILQTKKFIEYLNKYKFRIFSRNSETFNNLMVILKEKDSIGEKRESSVVKKLKEIYGEDNVIKVGELGSKRDTKDGVDCEIIINGEVLTAQIKPFLKAEDIGENFKMHNTGNVKPYKTNFIIFSTMSNKIMVFKNDDITIKNGNYIIPKKNLIHNIY